MISGHNYRPRTPAEIRERNTSRPVAVRAGADDRGAAVKITAETLSMAHLRHLRDECSWRRTPVERFIYDDAEEALNGNSAALDRCVTHWHEMFSEDIDALDVREKAALICQVVASNDRLTTEHQAAYHLGLLGFDDDGALRLATLAIWEADAMSLDYDWPETFARAEALIRDGWEPS